MSNPQRPHGLQPTRLPRPWDSPSKSTGVGCHLLLQYMKVKSEREVAQSCPTLRDPMDCSPPGSSVHRIFQARVLVWGAIAFSAQASGNSQLLITFTGVKTGQVRQLAPGHIASDDSQNSTLFRALPPGPCFPDT